MNPVTYELKMTRVTVKNYRKLNDRFVIINHVLDKRKSNLISNYLFSYFTSKIYV